MSAHGRHVLNRFAIKTGEKNEHFLTSFILLRRNLQIIIMTLDVCNCTRIKISEGCKLNNMLPVWFTRGASYTTSQIYFRLAECRAPRELHEN